MRKIIESVPNFSEGRRPEVIKAIAAAASSVEGAAVLHIDRGEAANRTVITLAGDPEAVCEAAFRAVERAAALVDMRSHTGEHPRIGAADVLPLVPVDGVTLGECAAMARSLAARVGSELGIPVYCYEAAAFSPERRGLEACRRGQYEGLRTKMASPEWQPDFGPAEWSEHVARTGASVIGARNFLGAVNFNLSTPDSAVADAIAREVRTSGGGPHSLPALKALGWHIAEYGFAQVSTNLTDMRTTGLWPAFGAISAAARRRGVEVTGTEVIGLLPEWALTDAGRAITAPDGVEPGDTEAVAIAMAGLGLDALASLGRPFIPGEKIIERVLAARLSHV